MIKIEAQIKPTYSCTLCKKSESGTDTYRETFQDLNTLNNWVEHMKLCPPKAGIPVGWVSGGIWGVFCIKCWPIRGKQYDIY
jgi:hypothetical protein